MHGPHGERRVLTDDRAVDEPLSLRATLAKRAPCLRPRPGALLDSAARTVWTAACAE